MKMISWIDANSILYLQATLTFSSFDLISIHRFLLISLNLVLQIYVPESHIVASVIPLNNKFFSKRESVPYTFGERQA